ncbi:MAG: DUF4364 family protein [Eubacteriales bacterium]|nr:DUF4364 family protein [Eubacteriales bacterium]
MKDSKTLYKLIILYLMDKVDFQISNGQICAFFADVEYTDYFTVQQTIADMLDSGFLTKTKVRNTTHYEMTESGRETLRYFGDEISTAIQNDVVNYLKKNKLKMRNENSVIADYSKIGEDSYIARLQVKEKTEMLVDLSISVATERQAIRICDQWQKKNVEVYQYLIKELLS